jgi:hypothetical protein
MKKKTLLLVLVLMFISTNALSQNTIYGTVSGDAQEGINVVIYLLSCGTPQPHATVITDAQGYYVIGDLPNGRYLVGPDDAGYSFSSSYWVDIPQTEVQSHDFTSAICNLLSNCEDSFNDQVNNCSSEDAICLDDVDEWYEACCGWCACEFCPGLELMVCQLDAQDMAEECNSMEDECYVAAEEQKALCLSNLCQ